MTFVFLLLFRGHVIKSSKFLLIELGVHVASVRFPFKFKAWTSTERQILKRFLMKFEVFARELCSEFTEVVCFCLSL